MKKILLLAVVCALCLSMVSCTGNKTGDNSNKGADGGMYTISEMEGKYKAQGRTIMYDNGLALLSSANTFEFNANCEGKVAVNITGESTDKAGDVDVYFTAYVDGERLEERFLVKGDGEHEIVLCQDIAKGEHSFKIVRQTEWGRGNIYVSSVTLEGELMAAPADKELYIEFIGDSLTTGFGNLSDVVADDEWGGASVYQDATQAYPYFTADALDADLSVVAIQGIGSACGGWEFTMNEVYDNYPRVQEDDYTYKPERTADVVVINMLANDTEYRGEFGLSPKDVVAKAKELCEMARATHPDSVIIFTPFGFVNQVEKMIETELGGAANGYYTMDLPMDSLGKAAHPSVAGHESATQALVPFIQDILAK